MVLVIAVLYHLRDELDCQFNADTTGDDTLYFPDQRGELFSGTWSQWIAYDMRNQSTVGNLLSHISALMCH